MEDDDDFYGGGGNEQQNTTELAPYAEHDMAEVDPKMEPGEEQEDEEEEEDSDDDVQFTLEKPDGAKAEPPPGSRAARQQAAPRERSPPEAKPAKISTPAVKSEPRSGSSAAPIPVKGALTHDGKEGKDFPAIRSSQLDVNGGPTWPGNGKPITEVDIDADLADNSKPWRLPGTDQTDFFNYGFDEYTWTQYCVRQQTMASDLSEQKQADAQMKAMFGGGGSGGAPGGPNGMPSMPGMPGMPGNMEEMMQQMMSSGMSPEQFAQQMLMGGGMPGMPGGQGQQNQHQGGGGFGQQGGAFGGSNANSVSPLPQGGQGFQPPQGPSAQNQHGDQGGFPPNMEGYSPQQIAIMQQQQGSMGGGGGGGRGRRRGRGFY